MWVINFRPRRDRTNVPINVLPAALVRHYKSATISVIWEQKSNGPEPGLLLDRGKSLRYKNDLIVENPSVKKAKCCLSCFSGELSACLNREKAKTRYHSSV